VTARTLTPALAGSYPAALAVIVVAPIPTALTTALVLFAPDGIVTVDGTVAIAVAEHGATVVIDEAAKVAPGVDPSIENHGLADVVGRQRAGIARPEFQFDRIDTPRRDLQPLIVGGNSKPLRQCVERRAQPHRLEVRKL